MTIDTISQQLLPTLPGLIQGIVGQRTKAKGRTQYDVQCQRCFTIETPELLVLTRFLFPPCTIATHGASRQRLCPDCHVQVCTGHHGCAHMPGIKTHP